MIVADTNLLVYLLVQGPLTSQIEAVYRKDSVWTAPRLWRSEFRSALALSMRRGLLTLDDALIKMRAAELMLGAHEFEVNSGQVLSLAAASGCTSYDCEFVALAQSKRVPLITSDRQVLSCFKNVAVSPQDFCTP